MTKAELLEQLRDARNKHLAESDYYDAFDSAAIMAEKLDDPPMPVQQEPSALEVVMRLVGEGTGMNATECVGYAFRIIDAVRAEEARRAGK